MAFKRGLVIEPSGAAALAAFLTGKVNFKYTPVQIPSPAIMCTYVVHSDLRICAALFFPKEM